MFSFNLQSDPWSDPLYGMVRRKSRMQLFLEIWLKAFSFTLTSWGNWKTKSFDFPTQLKTLIWGRFHQTLLPSKKTLAHSFGKKLALQFHQHFLPNAKLFFAKSMCHLTNAMRHLPKKYNEHSVITYFYVKSVIYVVKLSHL